MMTLRLRTLWFFRCQGGSGRTALFFSPLPWAAEAGVAGVTSRRPTRSKIWTVIWHGLSRTLEEKRCYKVMEEPNLSKIIDKLIRLINHQNFGWKCLSGPNEHHSPRVLSPSDQRSFVLWQDCSVMKKPRQENTSKAQTVDEASKFCWYSSWK